MIKCILCKSNVADKKGSHIVPHFLLKRVENIDNKKGRDYELGYSIGEFNTESYFGRAVSTEKLESTYGDLTDEEIENNRHPLVVDNVFCTSCEKKLSVIESEYAKTLNKKNTQIYSSEIKVEISFLFWMSIIWRMSINKKSGTELTSGENEILRRILNRYLAESLESINIAEMKLAEDLKKISYKILRSPDYSDKNFTFLLLHPEYRKPYCLLLDEYLILFSFKDNYYQYNTKGFFGFNENISKIPNNKIGNENEEIYYMKDEYLLNINNSIIDKLKEIRVSKIKLFLNKLHKSLGFKGTMNPEIMQNIFSEITSEKKKLGRKYTIEDLKKSTYEILKK